MIRAVQPLPPNSPVERSARKLVPSRRVYNGPFWATYASNLLFMSAVSLLFRYADFVQVLGGSELHLGWIVGLGMVGSLLTRLIIGSAIDRRGARLVWLGASAVFAISCFGNLWVTDVHSAGIYLLRLGFCCGIAATVGASMTFIGAQAPPNRLAEMIGMLGTSGFLGLIVGTQVGDLLVGQAAITRETVNGLFVAAGFFAIASGMLAWLATRGHPRPVLADNHPAAWGVLRRYFPWPVFGVGVALGMGLVLLQTFLRTFTAELGIAEIGLFFSVYALSAVVTRVLTRQWPDRFGPNRMMFVGLVALAASQLLLLPVRVEWHLIVSGIAFGFGHAVLFPSIVAAGTIGFPAEHRGLATTMILSSWDAGQLIGAPVGGAVLHYAGQYGLPRFPTLFIATAGMLLTVAVCFFFVRHAER
jgi:MFS family permease